MAADIRALTGVRGVAAAIIVIYHFGDVQLSTGGTASYFRIPFGYLIVDLFFMLSGFVMALTYRDAFAQLTLPKFATFMLKRVARLYPAYFVIGLFYIAKIAAGLSGERLEMYSAWDWIGNLLMMSGWGLHIFPVIGVAWAASAEMGSYLLLPILMAFTLRRSPAICAVSVAAALLAIYVVSVSGRGSGGPLDVVNGNSFYPLLRAVAGFALGLSIFRFAGVVDRLSMRTQDALVVGILVAILTIGYFSESDLPMYLLFIPLVAVPSRGGRAAQALFGGALVYRLGIISYSIYLIHPLFVSFAVRAWRYFGQTEAVFIAASCVCFAIIWALSEVSYRLVEMPGRHAIVAWFGPKQASPRVAAAPER
ncbi:acyltransferase [Tardiphaga sp. vice304]|uniref:acyltransferase family protein n=1 Tax=Tardiphaga sp. vice304 TaxID=2592817 RepID=UPI0011651CEF|nr:acyltransferase [Tardiphaga sp. vice304]QDM28668.1 acyltransferase [Tardiphaga sp. vice304]